MFRINLILWYIVAGNLNWRMIFLLYENDDDDDDDDEWMNVIANSLIINKYYNSKENIDACAT